MPNPARQAVVLHVITDLDVGGAEVLLAEIARHRRDPRFRYEVAYFYARSTLPDELRAAGVGLHRLPSRAKFDPRSVIGLARILRRDRVPLLHTHLIQADWAGFLANRLAGRPARHLSTKHNLHYFRDLPRACVAVDRLVNRGIDRHLAVSQAVADFYRRTQRLPAAKLHVLPNGIDAGRFAEPRRDRRAVRQELGLPPAAFVLVTVANVTRQKGHVHLLAAVRRLLPQRPDLHWLVVGGGKLRAELERQVRQAGLERNAHLLGPRLDVPDLLHAADLFVLPSLWEGFGISALEAAAAGMPIVASGVDGLAELFRDGENALLVTPGDPAALAEAIARMADQPELRRRLGAAARERAAAFAIEEVVRRLESHYLALLGAG